MQLPAEREQLEVLDDVTLRQAISERRAAIRSHRDQRMDDRCWIDDIVVGLLVSGLVTAPVVPFDYQEAMCRCTEFYRHRRADQPDPVPPDAIADPAHWDDDLATASREQLLDMLTTIQAAIVAHYRISGRPKNADDDRALYGVLPEKIPADLRLPPEKEFLGEAKAPDAGCPAFWRSHDGCGPECDLTRWGPCKNE